MNKPIWSLSEHSDQTNMTSQEYIYHGKCIWVSVEDSMLYYFMFIASVICLKGPVSLSERVLHVQMGHLYSLFR